MTLFQLAHLSDHISLKLAIAHRLHHRQMLKVVVGLK